MDICFAISEINWSITKDFVSIVGTIGALTIGGMGLSTWKKQLRGTSEYELAKKAILMTYQVQQAIQSVRNPMLHLSQDDVETGNKLQAEQKIYEERLNSLSDVWAELQIIRLEAKAIWSSEAYSVFDDLNKCVRKINADIWLHFWLKGACAGSGATVDRSPERVIKNDKDIYYVSDDDPFSQQIILAVKNIEDYFLTKVRAK